MSDATTPTASVPAVPTASVPAAPAAGVPKDTHTRVGDRAGPPLKKAAADLGLLAELQGNWRGKGFNITARPFFNNTPPFFLEINATQETLDFNAITGDIPNRGSLQPDAFLHGVRYLQQVTDIEADQGIHIEPGIWLHVPATTQPPAGESYVRQANIPHGDSLLAQTSFFTTVQGGPDIQPVDTTPFTDATIPGLNASPTQPITNPVYMAQYLNDPLPKVAFLEGLNAAATIKDPTLVLKKQIAGQTILNTVVLVISTVSPGSLINIPFVTKNANATQMDAIFWIEEVSIGHGRTYMQLQYVQRVILDFIGIKWPHISVATLKRL